MPGSPARDNLLDVREKELALMHENALKYEDDTEQRISSLKQTEDKFQRRHDDLVIREEQLQAK